MKLNTKEKKAYTKVRMHARNKIARSYLNREIKIIANIIKGLELYTKLQTGKIIKYSSIFLATNIHGTKMGLKQEIKEMIKERNRINDRIRKYERI